MACDTRRVYVGQQIEERRRQVEENVAKLERALGAGTVKVKIGPEGSITFVGWEEGNRNQISDVCAYRKLTTTGSFELRRAIASAEAVAGRKVNPQAIGAGVHSHDGGHSWHRGHK